MNGTGGGAGGTWWAEFVTSSSTGAATNADSLPAATAGDETLGLPGDTGVVKRIFPDFRSMQKRRPPSLPT